MKLKTSELTGAALDWAVALAYGVELEDGVTPIWFDDKDDERIEFTPSTDWAQGGPIIEREGVSLECDGRNDWRASMWWDDENSAGDVQMRGPTPLIAAMRAYVASKLGDEVEIPEELQ